MSEEEANYKRQIWVLENEKKNLVQQLERLEGRLQEYVTWTEQAQKILEENKTKINKLEEENKVFSRQVNQGTVAMSNNLLDENAQVKRNFQDLEEQYKTLNELLMPLVKTHIMDLDSNLRKKLVATFSKGDNERKIFALFVLEPSNKLTLSDISKTINIPMSECSLVLQRLINDDFLREISPNTYQTIAAVGDKIVSSKDLSRVSTEALHNYIIEQISSTIDSSRHLSYLDDYSNELQKRGETSLAQKIIAIKGDLHMAKRPSDWIVDHINVAIDKEGSVPLTARHSQQTSKLTSSRGFTSSYTTPEISSRNRFQSPVNQPSTQLLSIDTKEWTKLSNADVIDNLKLQISDRMDYLAVIEGLNALRDHLSSSVSGRALYQINNLINVIKNKKAFDKNKVYDTLVDLMTKV